jgi:hypothetical protein
MGYNIDSAEIVKGTGTLRVSAKNARKLAKLDLPEGFRESIKRLEFGDDGFAPLDVFWWYGEGSGWAHEDERLGKAVALIEGCADVILTWEGGESHSGLRIRNGKVTKCGVTLTLDPEVAK